MKGLWGRLQSVNFAALAKSSSGRTGQRSPGPDGEDTTDAEEEAPSMNMTVEEFLSKQRNSQLRKHFLDIEASKYTTTQEVRVWSGTFNVNGSVPGADHNLAEWLLHPGDRWPEREGDMAAWRGPDVLIIGFQEINALDFRNVVGGGGTLNVDAWETAVGCVLNREPLPPGYASAQEALAALDTFSSPNSGALDQNDEQEDSGRKSNPYGSLPPISSSEAGRENAYVRVTGRLMVGVYLSVWARAAIAPHVTGVQATEVRTGAMGYLGNKGCVAVRMRVYDTPLCALVAHLASGETPGDDVRRTADFVEMQRTAAFPMDAPAPAAGIAEARTPPSPWRRSALAVDQENVILVGDLNYRLRMADSEARSLLAGLHFDRLHARDQLCMELDTGTAFRRWREGALTFPPTFKYVKGTSVYLGDTAAPGSVSQRDLNPWLPSSAPSATSSVSGRPQLSPDASPSGAGAESRAQSPLRGDASGANTGPSAGPGAPSPPSATAGGILPAAAALAAAKSKGQKARTPAWTDRILWKSDRGQMHQLSYTRAELNLSDHKPVMATFLLHAEQVHQEQVSQCLDMARRLCDMDQNLARPRCTLDSNIVDVGDLAYGASVSRSVTLTNIGEAPSSFALKPLEGHRPSTPHPHAGSTPHQPCTPAWLSVVPSRGVLAPGDSMPLRLTASVAAGELRDAFVAEDLASAACTLDAILTLHIDGGMDHFLVVNGTFRPSFFGLSMTTLAGMARPLAGPTPDSGAESSAAPFEPPAIVMDGPDYTVASDLPFPRHWHNLPQELQQLLHFLARDDCLRTEGVFTDSLEVMRFADESRADYNDGQNELRSVADVRQALDAGGAVPPDSDAHAAAATLISYFRALPHPLIPEAVAHMCSDSLPPAASAATKLKQALAPVEWAVLSCALHVIKLALAPSAVESNKHTAASLAAYFAEAWFPPIDLQPIEDEDEAETPGGGPDFRHVVARAADLRQRRGQFLGMFLMPPQTSMSGRLEG